MSGNYQPVEQLWRNEIGGGLNMAIERLRSNKQLSLRDLAQRCREGENALVEHYSLPHTVARKISQSDDDLFMKTEELELPIATDISLNISSKGRPEDWRTLEQLSAGQKATAMLLLLLLESKAPLAIDQPEDDLDNRFITSDIIPIVRQEKQHRQIFFTTHNANIPVLGDAELIFGLTTTEKDGEMRKGILPEHMGAIDSESVQELVEEVLEGGKSAFEMRRSKYGF